MTISERIKRIDAQLANARGEEPPAELLLGECDGGELLEKIQAGELAVVTTRGLAMLRDELRTIEQILAEVLPLARAASCRRVDREIVPAGDDCCRWAVLVERIAPLF